MTSATFFGHRNFNYSPYKDKLRGVLVDLIENRWVRVFYNGFRGGFDYLCAEVVFGLKKVYPDIKNIMVLSYLDTHNFALPEFFDESVYLLEKPVLPKFAISYTNQEMVLRSDYVVSGVRSYCGGAYSACVSAMRKKKIILDIFGDM